MVVYDWRKQMRNSNNTPFMVDVEQLCQQYEEVNQYDDLNETEQDALCRIGDDLDRLYDSAKTREILSEVRWDRIEENAHDLVGDVNNSVGVEAVIDPGQIPDDGYREMVEEIDSETRSIIESLNRIEELSGELNEHSG